MNPFDNTNLKYDLCGGCDCTGFVANVTFTYNSGANTITLTDASTYPAGDDRKIARFRIHDKNDKTIDAVITAGDGDDAITASVATLDLSEGFTIFGTVVTNLGCISDGHFGRIGMIIAAGKLGSWDRDSNNILINNVDPESN